MNPLFVILVFIIALLVWAGIAFLFPTIGKYVKRYFKSVEFIMENEVEDEEDETW